MFGSMGPLGSSNINVNDFSPTNSLDVLKIEFWGLVHSEDVRHICTLGGSLLSKGLSGIEIMTFKF